jgi:hypothetical protein
LSALQRLDVHKHHPIIFVRAATDTTSEARVHQYLENRCNHDSSNKAPLEHVVIHSIPRSREVGQSFFNAFFTTIYSFIFSVHIVFISFPRILICNGPGTCVPLCWTMFLVRVCLLPQFMQRFLFRFMYQVISKLDSQSRTRYVQCIIGLVSLLTSSVCIAYWMYINTSIVLFSVCTYVMLCIFLTFVAVLKRHPSSPLSPTSSTSPNSPIPLNDWTTWFAHTPKVIFIESFARVQGLSLSGKFLYPIASRFIVQWPQLASRYSGAEYVGRLCWSSPALMSCNAYHFKVNAMRIISNVCMFMYLFVRLSLRTSNHTSNHTYCWFACLCFRLSIWIELVNWQFG